MRFTSLLYSLFPCGIGASAILQNDPQDASRKQIGKMQEEYNGYVQQTIRLGGRKCNSKNIMQRQEWGSLSVESRLDYIKAVHCLGQKASLYSKRDVPGAHNHYDDFTATHLLRAPYIHWDGLFLPFHRYFIFLYEKTLRHECGYTGSQPYWDWTLSWEDQRKSTVFDGSPYSMGGNGKAIPHGPTIISALGINLTLPAGTGGGCIESGPFMDWRVNLGPTSIQPPGAQGGLAYNPRCLERDISLAYTNRTRPTDVLNLLQGCDDIGCFDTALEDPHGLHPSGHFLIGGPSQDAFASVGDPAFFLHHAQIDRMWAIWQSVDPKNRTFQVFGTGTAFNKPPSPSVTLDTEVDFGILAPKQKVGDILSTLDGPFCYEYI